MGNFKDLLSPEERAFCEAREKKLKREADYSNKKFDAFHKWGDQDTMTSTYFSILNIPEKLKEKFGIVLPLPKEFYEHRGVKSWSKKGTKNTKLNLFPNAKRFNIQAVSLDDDGVHYSVNDPKRERIIDHVDVRIAPYVEKYWEAKEQANQAMMDRFLPYKNISSKKRHGWVGIGHLKDADKKVFKKFECFNLSTFYWNKSIDDQILAPRKISEDEFIESLGDEAGLMSEEELAWRYASSCAPLNKFPWDYMQGYQIKMKKQGGWGTLKYTASKSKAFPYVPIIPAAIKKQGGDLLAKFQKVAKIAQANMVWIIGEAKAGRIPSFDKHFGDITSKQQFELLGMKKETRATVKIEVGDDVTTTMNKLDDLEGKERECIEVTTDIDLVSSETEVKSEPIPEVDTTSLESLDLADLNFDDLGETTPAVSADTEADDLIGDLDGFGDIEEPF